jgi:hypothetical protein
MPGKASSYLRNTTSVLTIVGMSSASALFTALILFAVA